MDNSIFSLFMTILCKPQRSAISEMLGVSSHVQIHLNRLSSQFRFSVQLHQVVFTKCNALLPCDCLSKQLTAVCVVIEDHWVFMYRNVFKSCIKNIPQMVFKIHLFLYFYNKESYTEKNPNHLDKFSVIRGFAATSSLVLV